MKKEIPQEIKDWIFFLSSSALGKGEFPLCPWAKKTLTEGSVDYWEGEDPKNLVPLPEGIRVRILHLPESSHQDLIQIRNECNREFRDWIFLESHPDDGEEIGGIRSVGDRPMILIQGRKELQEARESLRNTPYYSYWDPEILDSILAI
jgi:hypothetical protein